VEVLVSGFRPQDATIYRPYSDEMPWELLFAGDPDEQRVYGYADADYMRVAKYEDRVIGVYVVQALSPTRYQLCNLVVEKTFRRRGLGGWLLGHAIGLSESKGGREILLTGNPLRGLFEKVGFERQGRDLLLTLTPE